VLVIEWLDSVVSPTVPSLVSRTVYIFGPRFARVLITPLAKDFDIE
jgi:hypothetical protein